MFAHPKVDFAANNQTKSASIYRVSPRENGGVQKILTANTKKKKFHTKSLTSGGGAVKRKKNLT